MTTVIAALVAATVATFGYVLTMRTKQMEGRREAYASALAAVQTYKSLPYRIRRRGDSSAETRTALGKEISDVLRDLDYYAQLLQLDSKPVGAAYRGLVLRVREKGKEHREHAWRQPPATSDETMSFAEVYEYNDRRDRDWCITQMKDHLRIVPMRRRRRR